MREIWVYALTNLQAVNNFTFFSLLFPSFLQTYTVENTEFYLSVYFFCFLKISQCFMYLQGAFVSLGIRYNFKVYYKL